ncbi:MAG: ABC transporter ATP-binding protein [Deltaproteobacteria bacterium]|nr:ABC transporter ATP-binding protein [Deltaproteobacteria bacterium]
MKRDEGRPEVELLQVSKRYGAVTAVDRVDLSIARGELVTLLGPSGCGKTTTLRMIAGLELATEGQIRIDGKDVTNLPATHRDVSMVFQSYALFPHMTVGENVAYGLLNSGVARQDALQRAEAGLAQVGLEGYGARLPSALSGGQQQRVAVARALVLQPKVLLFDEPLSNLDARLRRKMREDIRALQQSLGFTAVYVTHDQEEALSVSDRIVLMDKARIAQQGSPRDLYQRPDTEFVARFIGDANIIEAEVVEVEGDEARVRLGPLRLTLPRRGVGPGSAKLAVRPHGLEFTQEGLPARITSATYLGDHMEYGLTSEVGELFMVASDVESPRTVGDAVSLGVVSHATTLVAP